MLKNTTTRVLGPGPTAKFIGTIAQDSVQKKKKMSKIHIVSGSIYYQKQFKKKKRSTYCQKKKKKKEKSEVVFEKEK